MSSKVHSTEIKTMDDKHYCNPYAFFSWPVRKTELLVFNQWRQNGAQEKRAQCLNQLVKQIIYGIQKKPPYIVYKFHIKSTSRETKKKKKEERKKVVSKKKEKKKKKKRTPYKIDIQSTARSIAKRLLRDHVRPTCLQALEKFSLPRRVPLSSIRITLLVSFVESDRV